MQENSIFDKLDFGPLRPLLDNDDVTDISYCNGGQIWIRSLTQGSLRVEIPSCTPEFMEKLAFQCSNAMGTTFNNAKPFLDAESSELRLNFVHDSIATNGIACVIRKTPAKIRLEKEKLLKEDYFSADIHDILIQCVLGHCNIIVAGETGSGKTEFVKYLASHTKQSEKIITIEDTLELHLDKIFPQRDIVAMKTNNVASYTDVLVTCMRQNPKWILLSEVRSAEAVSAVRNSISSGHNILSTIHADKASAIPYRLYSLMETDLDVDQFLTTIYRYVQIGVHIKAYYSKKYGKFHREVDEVTEFYVDDNNKPQSHTIYRKMYEQAPVMNKPSAHLIEYLANQNVDITNITDHMKEQDPLNSEDDDTTANNQTTENQTNIAENNIGQVPEANNQQTEMSTSEQNNVTEEQESYGAIPNTELTIPNETSIEENTQQTTMAPTGNIEDNIMNINEQIQPENSIPQSNIINNIDMTNQTIPQNTQAEITDTNISTQNIPTNNIEGNIANNTNPPLTPEISQVPLDVNQTIHTTMDSNQIQLTPINNTDMTSNNQNIDPSQNINVGMINNYENQ